MPGHRRTEKRGSRPKMSIRTGDEVIVITGKDKGKRGKVIRVFPEANRVIVENVNIVKRHLRRQQGSLQAGIIEKPAPLHRSNVMLIDPGSGQPTRISRRILADGTHARVAKKSGDVLDKEH